MLMFVPIAEIHCEGETDRHPLLMDRGSNTTGHEHLVDIPPVNNVENLSAEVNQINRSSISTSSLVSRTSSMFPDNANSENGSVNRRADNYVRRNRNPLNSGLWISVELAVNISQIVAAIFVLCVSRNEHPHAPLFEWIIGYTVGCVATLPHLYWRYIHRNNQGSTQESSHSNQTNIRNNTPEYESTSVTANSGRESNHSIASDAQVGQNMIISNPRINALFDHFKMGLDCFFAAWFVVGNVWIFGDHSSPEDAPNLFRLCIVFLAFSCVGYAMPFILCAIICCCLPCIISVMGFREGTGHDRGATPESINSLPTYKFKSKRRHNRGEGGSNSDTQGGGVFAPGTDKERIMSAEDAVCCICLAKYLDNEELRELPCRHFFHKGCVDKWLKINALCPLCKSVIENSASSTTSSGNDRNRWMAGSSV
ncbi:E3 ubiquitin-protein ligase At1g63170-like [Curcuma longa]|uniref:E3 ubiquitin-protein ligase At1g63170-like n=1 Tax=Curcuma longa TaxID=136217 RepID=UPI003D9F58F6